MTNQEKEIATIKERTLKLNLSDSDCEDILIKAEKNGLTVAQLLEGFIADLVGGTFSHGSDEREYADQWFERCFHMSPKNTLLHHLLDWGFDPEEYLDVLDNIKTAEASKKYGIDHPEEMDEEEMSYLDDDLDDWREELRQYTEEWKPAKEPDMSQEIEALRKFIIERVQLKDEAAGNYKDPFSNEEATAYGELINNCIENNQKEEREISTFSRGRTR